MSLSRNELEIQNTRKGISVLEVIRILLKEYESLAPAGEIEPTTVVNQPIMTASVRDPITWTQFVKCVDNMIANDEDFLQDLLA